MCSIFWFSFILLVNMTGEIGLSSYISLDYQKKHQDFKEIERKGLLFLHYRYGNATK